MDNIELLKEEINRKDLQLIREIYKRDILIVEDRIKKCKKYSDWNSFVRMAKNDIDNGKEMTRLEFSPMDMMCKFIENCGDPLVYIKATSMSYPEHPFSQMLINCETVSQFLNKLKPLQAKFHIIFLEDSKKWLSELFDEHVSLLCHLHDSQERLDREIQ